MANTPISVLVSSASGKFPLVDALIHAVNEVDSRGCVIVGDISAQAPTLQFYKNTWVMPKTTDRNFSIILKELLDKKITHVFPTRDGELIFWAKKKLELLNYGIIVLVSSKSSIETCVDKLKFYNFGLLMNLPFIETSKILSNCTSKNNKYVVKEQYGSGSKSVFINLDYEDAYNVSKKLINPIFQPFIEGTEISVDAYYDKQCNFIGLSLRKRDNVIEGESQITSTFRDLNLEKEIEIILSHLKLSGCVVIQAIIDSFGKIHIIECNARFGGASTVSQQVGLHSLKWAISEKIETINKKPIFIREDFEVVQHRINIDHIKRL